MMAKRKVVAFLRNENVLKSIVVKVVQLFKYTKSIELDTLNG